MKNKNSSQVPRYSATLIRMGFVWVCLSGIAVADTGFIDTLLTRGFYRAAEVECSRELRKGVNDTCSIWLRQGVIAQWLHNTPTAHEYYEKVAGRGTPEHRIAAGFRLAAMALEENTFDLAAYELNEIQPLVTGVSRNLWHVYGVVLHLYQHDVDAAYKELYAIPEGSEAYFAAQKLMARYDEYMQYPVKNSKAAYYLSSFIPGSGQMYAGHTMQGVKSFFLNMAFGVLLTQVGMQGYRAWQQKDDVAQRVAAMDIAVVFTGFFTRYYNAGRTRIFKEIEARNESRWKDVCADLLNTATAVLGSTLP